MVYHWGRFALNELYESSIQQTPELERARQHRLPWPIGLATLERACIAYASKTNQLNSVKKIISADQLMVLDYDELIRAPAEVLRHVFAFVGEAYDDHYASTIRSDTLGKADRLSSRERVLIEDLALPVYVQCKSLLSAF